MQHLKLLIAYLMLQFDPLKLPEKSQLIGSKHEQQNAKREPLCKRQRLTIKSQEEDLQTAKYKEDFR